MTRRNGYPQFLSWTEVAFLAVLCAATLCVCGMCNGVAVRCNSDGVRVGARGTP